MAVVVYVGVGSNLGDREENVALAVRELDATPGLRIRARSLLHETEPVGGPPQGRYLNGVIALECELSPRALLHRLREIEQIAGRERGPERNAPRTLDLDLLLFGDTRIDEPGLTVPHPRMHERGFVLVPLCEIAPDARHPLLEASAAELRARLAGDAREPNGGDRS